MKLVDFMKILDRPKTAEEAARLQELLIPYVVHENESECFHGKCGCYVKTKTYTICVPSEDVTIQMQFAHYDSDSRVQSCKESFEVRLLNERIGRETIDYLLNSWYQSCDMDYDLLDPTLDIIQAAIDSKKQDNFNKHNSGILRIYME